MATATSFRAVEQDRDMSTAMIKNPPVRQQQPDEPQQHQITITVPKEINEATVRSALNIGMTIMQRMEQGLMVLTFPQVQQDEQGNPRPVIGKSEVYLVDEQDIRRMVSLGQRITQANMKMVQERQKGPSHELAATMQAKKDKDNAVREAEGDKAGTGGIIIP